ncbi:MAG: cytochrome b N-terminal domain-containing protein [Planctomycetes bacterium]|nr:cytochrome b N-terminal domain-containing protein [Planctomycetota bacterium]
MRWLRPFRTLRRELSPTTPREASDAVVRNLMLHAFPARATKRALAWGTTGWLGTVTLGFFLVLCATGGVLLLLYVPSVERAYASMKDLESVVVFGSWLRGTHRAAAHLMVVAVVLHLVRVFLTGAYKKEGAPGAFRPLNWLVGIGLLVVTLGLSFTGYLLPWDQLAYWAVTVGTRIAASVPLVGEQARHLLLGGSSIGQPTLTRFYALHCFVLPAATLLLTFWHLWRVRKDGGLAASDRVVDDAIEKARHAPAAAGKSYTLLGTTAGGTVSTRSPAPLLHEATSFAVPNLVRRAMLVLLATLALSSLLGLVSAAPLEQAADPERTPNPAKAPWYFLWLQELVSILSFEVGGRVLDGAFLGGIVVPGLLLGLLAAWPWLDRSPREAAGLWFHPARRVQCRVFLALLLVVVALGVVGTFFRGPYWAWTSPFAPTLPVPTRV